MLRRRGARPARTEGRHLARRDKAEPRRSVRRASVTSWRELEALADQVRLHLLPGGRAGERLRAAELLVDLAKRGVVLDGDGLGDDLFDSGLGHLGTSLRIASLDVGGDRIARAALPGVGTGRLGGSGGGTVTVWMVAAQPVHLERNRRRENAVVVAALPRPRRGMSVGVDEGQALVQEALREPGERTLPDRPLQLRQDERASLDVHGEPERLDRRQVRPRGENVPIQPRVRWPRALTVAKQDVDGLAEAAGRLDRDQRVRVPAAEEVKLLGVEVGVDLAVKLADERGLVEADDVGGGVVLPAPGRGVDPDRVLDSALRLLENADLALLRASAESLGAGLHRREVEAVERRQNDLAVLGECLPVEVGRVADELPQTFQVAAPEMLGLPLERADVPGLKVDVVDCPGEEELRVADRRFGLCRVELGLVGAVLGLLGADEEPLVQPVGGG